MTNKLVLKKYCFDFDQNKSFAFFLKQIASKNEGLSFRSENGGNICAITSMNRLFTMINRANNNQKGEPMSHLNMKLSEKQ